MTVRMVQQMGRRGTRRARDSLTNPPPQHTQTVSGKLNSVFLNAQPKIIIQNYSIWWTCVSSARSHKMGLNEI